MGSKKKKRRIAEAIHDQHHQSVHDYIVGQIPTDHHVMPRAQPWHTNEPWCFCAPVRDVENPLTGKVLWIHRAIIH
jgi:hypothetical protein